MTPITELSNPLTYYMDISNPKDIVRMMRSCDGQISRASPPTPQSTRRGEQGSGFNLRHRLAGAGKRFRRHSHGGTWSALMSMLRQ